MVGRSKGCSEGAAKVVAKAGKLHLRGADQCALNFKDRTNDKERPQPTMQTSIMDDGNTTVIVVWYPQKILTRAHRIIWEDSSS